MNSIAKILWVDDEIELLKPHLMFLRARGYEVEGCNNGYDAIEMIAAGRYDLVILDEMMPGMTGLETLPYIKEQRPGLPVIMVTKSEEEMIMDKAIGSKIADYIIKPVNPNQVLLSIKKNIHSRQLVSEQSTADYRAEFGRIAQSLAGADTFADWKTIYKKLVGWEVSLSGGEDTGIRDVLAYQREEAGVEFCKFVRRAYPGWIAGRTEGAPLMSHTLMRGAIMPEVERAAKAGRPTTMLLIDNFRYDQWLAVRDLVGDLFDVETEDFYCSILPTATQYARNAIFAGLTPLAIDKLLPDKWFNDNEEGGKNQYEEQFLRRQLQGAGKTWRTTFDKLVRPEQGRRLIEGIQRLYDADFSVIVYNFLDILSHARTETEVIRTLTEDDAAFRSLTRSWFEHSDLHIILRMLAAHGHRVVVTSDHGTIRVDRPVKVIADRETSQNLRYKTGKRIGGYNPKDLFEVLHPEELQLPRGNLSSTYVFATGRDYIIYQNNASQFVRYYRHTFQHGGISMEEMIVPYIVLEPKI
jgi:CheY-like chemotaxis protein